MTFPAYTEFAADPGRTYARWAVYTALALPFPAPGRDPLPPMLAFDEPRAVKIAAVRARARLSMRRTIDALAWLIAAGYLRDHGRGHNRMHRLTLTFARDYRGVTTSTAA